MNRLAVVAVSGGDAEDTRRHTRSRRVGAALHSRRSFDSVPGGRRCFRIPGADSGQRRRRAAADQRAGGDLVDRSGQGRPPRNAGGDRREAGRGARVREQRTPRADASERRADGGIQSRRHGGIPLQGEGRQRGPRPDCEAAGLCGREEVPHAAAHSRRTQRAGCALVQLRAAVVRRQRLRCGGGELSRQFRTRRKIPDGDFRRLGQ